MRPSTKERYAASLWGQAALIFVCYKRKSACRHRRTVDDGNTLLHDRRQAHTSLSRVHTSDIQPLQLLQTPVRAAFIFSITSKHNASVSAKYEISSALRHLDELALAEHLEGAIPSPISYGCSGRMHALLSATW